MKRIRTTIGRAYAVTTAAGATVTSEDGKTLASVPAGGQGGFVSTSLYVEVSDDEADVVEVTGAGCLVTANAGGEAVVVDQAYDASSEHAQSGVAVAQAVGGVDDKYHKLIQKDASDPFTTVIADPDGATSSPKAYLTVCHSGTSNTEGKEAGIRFSTSDAVGSEVFLSFSTLKALKTLPTDVIGRLDVGAQGGETFIKSEHAASGKQVKLYLTTEGTSYEPAAGKAGIAFEYYESETTKDGFISFDSLAACAAMENVTITDTSIVISNNTLVNYKKGVLIGINSRCSSTSVAIGFQASADGIDSVALGAGALAYRGESIAIGGESIANRTSSIAIGYKSSAYGDNSIAIGTGFKLEENGVIGLCTKVGLNELKILFLAAGSRLSNLYADGEAGLAYVSGESSGCVKLSELCTREFSLE